MKTIRDIISILSQRFVTNKHSYEKLYSIERKSLGSGGNAIVKRAKRNTDKQEVAIKILKQDSMLSHEKRVRFEDEIKIMSENAPLIDGIIPILDYSSKGCWYTMPIAKPIKNHIKDFNQINEIIDGIIQLSETLIKLHDKGLSHRDIKPDNIYFFSGRYYLGDFGLVDIPDNPNDLTDNGDRIGAKYTIAPEMFRTSKTADGKKADVYSLAKTLWMLLKDNSKGFDGRYDFMDKSISLHSCEKLEKVHLVEINELLVESTKNLPEERPTMSEFRDKLIAWKDTYGNRKKVQSSNWNFINKYIFRNNPPSSCAWTDVEEIVRILNLIGNLPAYNYMIFSDSGGLDFQLAEKANEKGCIYVYATNICFLVKPKQLCLELFNDSEWNYFLLELDHQESILDEVDGLVEHLVEDTPAHYVSAQYAQYGVYDYDSGERFPEKYKIVHRYIDGKLLIVLKSGPYNEITNATDGRHGDCSSFEFKEYMNYIKNVVEEMEAKGISRNNILDHSFDKNPFKEEQSPKLEESIKTRRISSKYIKEKFIYFCFRDLVSKFASEKKGKIAFYYKFNVDNRFAYSSFLKAERLYLCKDGYIRALSEDDEDIFMVYGRDSAKVFFISLKKELAKFCNIEEDDYIDAHFEVLLRRIGKPTHLFTKEEIKDLMKNADDRVNNTMVIDEDGYARIINQHNERMFYPLRHETWVAGNIYVGKYSRLSTLDDTYLYSLKKWLEYLETNRRAIYADYVSYSEDEKTLVEKIEKYY